MQLKVVTGSGHYKTNVPSCEVWDPIIDVLYTIVYIYRWLQHRVVKVNPNCTAQ